MSSHYFDLREADRRNIYVIIKIMCSPSCQYKGFLAALAPERIMNSYTLLVKMNQRVFNKLNMERNISSYK